MAAPARAACVDPAAMQVEYGQVAFTQTRHLNGVRAPLVSRGMATIAQSRVDWHVNDPIDILTTISPAGISQSVEGAPAQRVAVQGAGDAFLSSAGLFDLLAGNFSALNTHYTVGRAASGADGAWRMRLTPRAAGLAQVVSYIEVAGCERVQNVEVRQANNDWMTIALAPAGR
jgi:hypothetical protein